MVTFIFSIGITWKPDLRWICCEVFWVDLGKEIEGGFKGTTLGIKGKGWTAISLEEHDC